MRGFLPCYSCNCYRSCPCKNQSPAPLVKFPQPKSNPSKSQKIPALLLPQLQQKQSLQPPDPPFPVAPATEEVTATARSSLSCFYCCCLGQVKQQHELSFLATVATATEVPANARALLPELSCSCQMAVPAKARISLPCCCRNWRRISLCNSQILPSLPQVTQNKSLHQPDFPFPASVGAAWGQFKQQLKTPFPAVATTMTEKVPAIAKGQHQQQPRIPALSLPKLPHKQSLKQPSPSFPVATAAKEVPATAGSSCLYFCWSCLGQVQVTTKARAPLPDSSFSCQRVAPGTCLVLPQLPHSSRCKRQIRPSMLLLVQQLKTHYPVAATTTPEEVPATAKSSLPCFCWCCLRQVQATARAFLPC